MFNNLIKREDNSQVAKNKRDMGRAYRNTFKDQESQWVLIDILSYLKVLEPATSEADLYLQNVGKQILANMEILDYSLVTNALKRKLEV